jgi:hypothetical protein
MEKEYWEYYSEVVNDINPNFDEWNNDFISKYPDEICVTNDGIMLPRYLDYICEHQNQIMNNGINKKTKLIDFYSGRETEGSIGCRLKRFSKIIMDIDYIPVK